MQLSLTNEQGLAGTRQNITYRIWPNECTVHMISSKLGQWIVFFPMELLYWIIYLQNYIPSIEKKSVDKDQLASSEASWYGSTVFSMHMMNPYYMGESFQDYSWIQDFEADFQ